MTRHLKFAFAVCCFAFVLALTAGVAAAATEAVAETAAAPETAAPAADLFVDAGCAAGTAAAAEPELFTPVPTEKIVCEFCNLNGFVNCESTHGKACNPGVPNRRCYINPPCACEWGICRCVGGTWNCVW